MYGELKAEDRLEDQERQGESMWKRTWQNL